MFTARWRVFQVLGIPLFIDPSWLIILTLVTWRLQEEVFSEQGSGAAWVLGLGMALAFFACIVLHELGHALVARVSGLPIRGITLFLFGGVAELGAEPRSARGEFFMAIAGPLVSAALGAGFALVAWAGRRAGWALPAQVVL